MWSDDPKFKHQNEEDLSDFECGIVVGAAHAGLSISEIANVLGFSHTTVCVVYGK